MTVHGRVLLANRCVIESRRVAAAAGAGGLARGPRINGWRAGAASGCFTTEGRRTAEATAGGDSADLTQKVRGQSGDRQARFDFAILLNARNRREEAAAEFIEIIKRDRAWNGDGARKQLLQFFDAWGAVDPATISARRKLSALLFS